MYPTKDFKDLDYDSLVDLLGKLTKQYTSSLTNDPHFVDDKLTYYINLLIEEIAAREDNIFDNNDNLSLSF